MCRVNLIGHQLTQRPLLTSKRDGTQCAIAWWTLQLSQKPRESKKTTSIFHHRHRTARWNNNIRVNAGAPATHSLLFRDVTSVPAAAAGSGLRVISWYPLRFGGRPAVWVGIACHAIIVGAISMKARPRQSSSFWRRRRSSVRSRMIGIPRRCATLLITSVFTGE